MLKIIDTLTLDLLACRARGFFSSAKLKLEILNVFGGKASDGESWSLLLESEIRSDGL